MGNGVIRMVCPSAELHEKERAGQIIKNLKTWAESEALAELLALYGSEIDRCLDFKEYISKLQDAAEDKWDFRCKKAKTENQELIERWQLEDEKFASDNEEFIMKRMRLLGFTDITEPLAEPDYICPLGGARRSNLDRCMTARNFIDEKGWQGKKVVALSCTRPIEDIEQPYIRAYAPFAQTEYEAICGGLETAFGLDNVFEEKMISSENINAYGAIRKYNGRNNDCIIYSVAAPSYEPDKRRANSVDTFVYLLEQFDIAKGERVLLTTNCIYQPRQLLDFIMLALEHGIEVDCVGVKQKKVLSKTTNYLQELKATIDTIKVFCEKYY